MEVSANLWKDLPDAVLLAVLEYRTCVDPALRLVCSGWRDSISSALGHLKPSALPLAGLSALRLAFPRLTSLDLSCCPHGLIYLEDVGSFDELRCLVLPSSFQLEAGSLGLLKRCHRLKSLDLSKCRVAPSLVFELLRGLTQLDELRVASSDASSGMEQQDARPSSAALRALGVTGMEPIACALAAPLSLSELRLTSCGPVGAAACSAIRRLRGLTSLSLERCHWDGAAEAPLLGMLLSLQGLRLLDLSACPVMSDAVLVSVAQARRPPPLRALRLSGCTGVTDQGLAQLSSLTSLKELSVANSGVTAAGALQLLSQGAGPSLEALDISDLCRAASEPVGEPELPGRSSASTLRSLRFSRGLQHRSGILSLVIGRRAPLTALDLTCNELPIDSTLQRLQSSAPGLRGLNLSESLHLTDRGVLAASGMCRLTALDISHCLGVTDAGLASVGSLPALASLDATGCCGIAGLGFAAWASAGPLRAVRLRHTELTDEGLRHLARQTGLRDLDLGHCGRLSPAGLRSALQALPDVRVLSLAGCGAVGDSVLRAAVSGMARLSRLDLSGCCAVTDSGLGSLQTCWMLRRLSISRCREVSQQCLAAIEEHLPNLVSVVAECCYAKPIRCGQTEEDWESDHGEAWPPSLPLP